MSLYDEYESYVVKYQSEYGANTIVLYQCGGFYEMYSIDDGMFDIHKVCEILYIQVSKRNKSLEKLDRSNSLMAGFPEHALEKFTQILVDHSYTVVIVSQVTSPPKPKRAVTAIVSPGTIASIIPSSSQAHMSCIFVDDDRNGVMSIGISVFDMSTGSLTVSESHSTQSDPSRAVERCCNIIAGKHVRELIVIGDIKEHRVAELISALGLNDALCHNKVNLYPNDVKKPSYQNHVLNRIYENNTMMSCIESVGLEKLPYATRSLVYLSMFVTEHVPHCIDFMKHPTIVVSDTSILTLEHNSAKQLAIVNTDKGGSLNSIYNNCVTSMGRRLFTDRLLYPSTQAQDIEMMYLEVDAILDDSVGIKDTRATLSKIIDVDAFLRRAVHGKVLPNQWRSLHQSVNEAIKLGQDCCESASVIYASLSVINVECESYDDFFRTGVYADLDCMSAELNVINNSVKNFLSLFPDGYIKLEDKETLELYMTSKRFRDLQAKGGSYMFNGINIDAASFSFHVSKNKSTITSGSVSFPGLDEVFATLVKLRREIRTLSTDRYNTFCRSFVQQNHHVMGLLSLRVASIDCMYTRAYNVHKFNLRRPMISDTHKGKAYFCGKKIRHPIVEHIQTNVQYVTNDIDLGVPNQDGILLFGVNCCGKSTLSKAIALNIVLAQSGHFTACDLQYFPYEHIFTRIPSGDDMCRGLSTFAVEMFELRNILKRCNRNSLIVGDEIAHGSEVVSASAIVAASLVKLADMHASFVFATHLHNVVDIPAVKNQPCIGVYHLHVECDPVTHTLVYDRKLRPGRGESTYGLEVCKAFGFPEDFISTAFAIRNSFGRTEGMHTIRRSTYNANKYVDLCQVCGEKADEVHHIAQQKDGDINGYVISHDTGNSVHLNSEHNLVSVCQECHDKIHNKSTVITGYSQTSNGIKLSVKHTSVDNMLEKELCNKVQDMRRQKQSYKTIASSLGLSVYTVKKYIAM